jgi:hypothetical protein
VRQFVFHQKFPDTAVDRRLKCRIVFPDAIIGWGKFDGNVEMPLVASSVLRHERFVEFENAFRPKFLFKEKFRIRPEIDNAAIADQNPAFPRKREMLGLELGIEQQSLFQRIILPSAIEFRIGRQGADFPGEAIPTTPSPLPARRIRN